jgi:hypothetical protein
MESVDPLSAPINKSDEKECRSPQRIDFQVRGRMNVITGELNLPRSDPTYLLNVDRRAEYFFQRKGVRKQHNTM